MPEDPAITKAKTLWQNGMHKDAMTVLVKRIRELSANSTAPTPGRASSSRNLFQSAIGIFTSRGWEIESRTETSIRLVKKQGVEWSTGIAATLILGIVGGLLISATRYFSKAEKVTLQDQESWAIRVTTLVDDTIVRSTEPLIDLAESVSGGIPPSWTLVLSLASYVFWLLIVIIMGQVG